MQQQLNLVAEGVKIPENVNRHLEMFHEHQEQTLRIHEQYLREQSQQSHSALQVNLNEAGLNQQGVEARPIVQAQTVRQASNPVVTQDPLSASPTNEVPVSTTSSTGGSRALSTDQMSDAVMGIVSEKTGYPSEMLALSMDLEADLGIDSIKRVEILGSLQDRLPNLPEVQGEDLAELRSLGQIVSHLEKLTHSAAGASSSAGAPSPTPPPPHDKTTESTGASDPASALLSVITEKTGYPAEMLEFSMDMEADLGIDSIKRVEIMWAIQERFPELPQLTGSELGELRTLQQIVDFMKQLMQGGGNGNDSAPIDRNCSMM